MEPILTPAGHAAVMLFDAVVANDHEALIKLYAANARNSLMSYISMKSRWAQQQERYTKAGKTNCYSAMLYKRRDTENLGKRYFSAMSCYVTPVFASLLTFFWLFGRNFNRGKTRRVSSTAK